MRLLILVNPKSGAGRGAALLSRYQRQPAPPDCSVTVADVTSNAVSQLSLSTFDLAVVAGGDGTVSRLLNTHGGFPIPIFVLPLGTGNDLARQLGVGAGLSKLPLKDLIATIKQCSVIKLQCWRLGAEALQGQEFIFCNYISFGLDGEVIERFDLWRKRYQSMLGRGGVWGNRLAYGLAALFSALIKSSRIEVQGALAEDARNLKTWNLLVTNIAPIAGLGISNKVSDPFDSKVELLEFSHLGRYLPVVGVPFLPGFKPRLCSTAEGLEFTLPHRVKIQIDGEPGSALSPQLLGAGLRGWVKISAGPQVEVLRCPSGGRRRSRAAA